MNSATRINPADTLAIVETAASSLTGAGQTSSPIILWWLARRWPYGQDSVTVSAVHRRAVGADRAPAALHQGQQGHPFRDNRKVVEAIIYRYRAGIPRRDLPREEFSPWQTVWKRHARYARDGTWDRVLQAILADADAAGLIDWNVSVDATICRAHQHGTNTTRPDQDTGGSYESTRRRV